MTERNAASVSGSIEAGAILFRRWRGPLSAGLIDQIVIAAANFGLHIAVARRLAPADYGAFAVALSVLLMISGPHSAMLSDAMVVVGPRRFPGHDLPYLRTLLTLHVALAGAVALVIAGVTFVPTLGISASSSLSLAFATLTVPAMWLMRASCYLAGRPPVAISGSVCYLLVLAVLLVLADTGSWLTTDRAVAVMGVASVAASLVMATLLGVLRRPWSLLEFSGVIREHWVYGRWMLGASVAHGLASGMYAPLVAVTVGLQQTAVMRAVQNLMQPLQQALTGITTVTYPSMSRSVVDEGPGYVQRRGFLFVASGVALAMAYGVAISALARPIMALMYGSDFYADQASLVWVAAVATVALALSQFLGILIRIVSRPQGLLWAKLAGLAWFAVPGIWLVNAAGVAGAFWSVAGAALAESIVLLVVLTRRLSAQTPVEPGGSLGAADA